MIVACSTRRADGFDAGAVAGSCGTKDLTFTFKAMAYRRNGGGGEP